MGRILTYAGRLIACIGVCLAVLPLCIIDLGDYIEKVGEARRVKRMLER